MTDRGGFAALDPCVHCGFCLQACPTFLATGDEADSPRGRIELMRALEAGELAPDDPALALHLDRCLGCRGCEPVCPSGVGYGRGLETARALLAEHRKGGVSPLARLALAAWSRIGFAMGMLAATKPVRRLGGWAVRRAADTLTAHPPNRLTVWLFRGCIMDGLFSHVHDATIRTLE